MEQILQEAILCVPLDWLKLDISDASAVSIFTSLLCIVVAGYDASLMTSLIAMQSFQETFNTGPTGPTISLIFGIYTV